MEFFLEKINPDIILFLGDSNSVLASVPLFKEGYKIGHIEGGMRSYDRRMPEEVNRVICDYVSDHIFVYTDLYKDRLASENKNKKQHMLFILYIYSARQSQAESFFTRFDSFLASLAPFGTILSAFERSRRALSVVDALGRLASKIPGKKLRDY